MHTDETPPNLWHGQLLNFGSCAILVALAWVSWTVLERPYPAAFWTAVAIPIVHQVYVWLAWRLELRSSLTSKTIGFRGYLVLFFLLFGARFVSLFALALLDQGSLPIPIWLQAIITAILFFIGLYAMYSVRRYFGMARAAGADHFDKRYRSMPLVNQGIYRFTNNGMYIYAFLLFWAVALSFGSTAALVVAAFSHAYIWVHFYAIERPDMEYLYANK